MLQAHRRHPAKALLLEGAEAADDQSGDHSHDLQGFQERR